MRSSSFTGLIDAVSTSFLLLLFGSLFVDNVSPRQKNRESILAVTTISESADASLASLLSTHKYDVCNEEEAQAEVPEGDEFNARKKDYPSSILYSLGGQRTLFASSTILDSEKLPIYPPPELC